MEKVIKEIKRAAKEVFKELGVGWPEVVYQEAIEVALRHRKIQYEAQRILPVTFKGHVVGQGIPDLVIWVGKTAIVVDLKVENDVKEDQENQVKKYISELQKQLHKGQKVYKKGLVINFIKDSKTRIEDGVENLKGVQILEVKA